MMKADIASNAQMLVYASYLWQGDAVEDSLFCKALCGHTTSKELFTVINEYFDKFSKWNQCVGVSFDGAAAMTGMGSGLVVLIKQVAPNVVGTHCMIYRETLAAKTIDESLADVFSACVQIVNFIKARPLNHRLFANLCGDMGAEHKHLLLHTEVVWLSRGRVVQRLYELREELLIFLNQHNKALSGFLADETWLAKLAYLADIFYILNDLNVSL
jgi:hypothetical protein